MEMVLTGLAQDGWLELHAYSAISMTADWWTDAKGNLVPDLSASPLGIASC